MHRSLGLRLKFHIPGNSSWPEPVEGRITISRNDSTIQLINSSTSKDTLIYDSGLSPNTKYTYSAASTGSASGGLLSKVEITTMDTTSHDFTWEIFTFGSRSSSVLYDVAIINENDIWAVGEIHTEETDQFDSLGNWVNPYNAVHWDGNEWELKRILFRGSCSAVDYPPIRAIWAFSTNNILFTNGGAIAKFNGTSTSLDCQINPLLTGAINKMWGTSSDDLYVVGGSGLIAHYDGTTWQRIESGTSNNLHDIWGISNDDTAEKTILIAAENAILEIANENKIESFDWPFSGDVILSVWFKNNFQIFICGDGAFKFSHGKGWEEFNELPNYKMYGLRGNDINDIFLVGAFGFIAHFNGYNWKNVLPNQNSRLISTSLKAKTNVSVGYDFSSSPIKARIIIIKQN